jgi:hypothetical protein
LGNNRKIGGKYEKEMAREFDSNVVRGSGSSLWHKGDIIGDTYCIQCKFTEKEEYLLKIEDLIKAEKESYSEKKDFLFCVGIRKDTYIIERVSKIQEKYPHIICNNKSIKINKKLFNVDEVLYLTFILNPKKYDYMISSFCKFQEGQLL